MAIYQDNRKYIERLQWIRVVFILGFVVLFVRLWYLSVIRFEYYSELAERNQSRVVPLPAPRGYIVDREGRNLVENNNTFDLLLFREDEPELKSSLDFLVSGLGMDRKDLEDRLAGAAQRPKHEPITLAENLSLEDVSYVLAHHIEHPEMEISRTPRRVYRYGKLAAHVLGYVGEVSLEELTTNPFPTLQSGDIVGKYGLEKTYNPLLTGTKGRRRLQVDSRGQALAELSMSTPVQGQPLTLTIDLDIQQEAERSLGENPGAVVVLDPNTGEILALVSHPSFDPNLFATRISRKDWAELTTHPDSPLQNRAIQGRFSPGSIFKVVMALAGLETGGVDPDTTVYCGGGIELYGHFFRCWSYDRGGHGRVNLVDAIQHSCNVYFYLLGRDLGIENIAAFSRRIGLGSKTGIDLFGEVEGLVPSPEWKRKTQNAPWYAGETVSVSIGQGPISVTPIQLAKAIGTVATGRTPQLRFVREEDLSALTAEPPIFDAENLRLVREGMWRGVNAGGTGWAARVEGFDVCGKTGTVQTVSRETRSRLSEEALAAFENNAWFVGFAPRDNPQIVVAVLVERGGSSGSSAAPAAGMIFRKFYEKWKERKSRRFEVAELSSDREFTPRLSRRETPPAGEE